MNSWLYPTTLFLAAFIIWILGVLFFKKRSFIFCLYLSAILGIIGILILFINGYGSLAIALLCIVFFFFLLHFGFDISFSQKKSSGPFSAFLYKQGIACTYLDPKGEIEIEGQKIPAITEGLMITQGSKIRIVRCAPKFVIVEKYDSE